MKNRFLFALFAICALGFISSAQAQNVPCYKIQGGAKQVIGSGCELEVASGGTVTLGSGTVTKGGVTQPTIRSASDAVASGQTSKVVTVTGVTASSRCFATAAEVATNSVSIRAAVPGTDTVTVTVSGDPGASNLDIRVLCLD
jgi:hypothetical protein